jgi:hypothetical protein
MVTIRGKERTWGELLKGAGAALFGVAFGGAFLAVGVLIIVLGSQTIAGAYDDPNMAIRCTAARTSDCVRVERGRVQNGGPDDNADLYVATERRVKAIQLVEGPMPEVGSLVDLETYHGAVVSLRDPFSERRYHTEEWPRHGRDVGAGILAILFGTAFAGVVVVPLIGAGLQALRRARQSSGAA